MPSRSHSGTAEGRRNPKPMMNGMEVRLGSNRPSYNIAVLKCQIDVAPLTSSLSHVPHMPSNRTPATRV